MLRTSLLAFLLVAGMGHAARADVAVSANDGKVRLVDGKQEVIKDGQDTVAVIDLAANPPKIIAEIAVPGSVVGPPLSVALTPKADLALVTAAMRIDRVDPTKLAPDNKLTVIDLRDPAKPSVIATLEAGAGAAGLTINKAGTLALVANRSEGTVSVFSIDGMKVQSAGEKVKIGDAASGPSGIVISADGKFALVSMDGDSSNKIAVLSIDGTKVEYAKRDLNAGLRPYGIDMTGGGGYAVVANIGRGGGDSDTVSVIDMAAKPPRVVNTLTVGQTPEGIKMSPNGDFVAITVMNGSNKPKSSPFFNEHGKLAIYKRTGADLAKVTEAPIGKWCQGIAWSAGSNRVLAQCMVEEEIRAFDFDGSSLHELAPIKTKGGPAGIRTAE